MIDTSYCFAAIPPASLVHPHLTIVSGTRDHFGSSMLGIALAGRRAGGFCSWIMALLGTPVVFAGSDAHAMGHSNTNTKILATGRISN